MIVADLSMGGIGHVYFNSAFLRILHESTDEDIHLFVEREHMEHLKRQGLHNRIIGHPHNLKQRFGIWVLYQDFLASLYVLYIMFFARDQRIILLNRLPVTLLVCNVFNLLLKRDVCNILHGELEYLVNPKVAGITKYYYKLFKLSYRISSPLNSYVFLGNSIKEQTLKAGISFGKSKFIVIDHPYEYNANYKYENPTLNNITIGMIGTATTRKNCFMLAELKAMITNKRISILNVGKAELDICVLYDRFDIPYFKTNLVDEDYRLLIEKLDYSLCFYDENINVALASGSFFDSIKFAKPIIALRGNPYVDYYFEKLGDIGFRFDTLKEMADFINGLDESALNLYCTQVTNLKRAQSLLSVSSITKEFRKQYYDKN